MESFPSVNPEAAGGSGTHPAVELASRARFEVLGAVLLGLFLSSLDQTIVGTALPRIVSDLSGNDLYTWVVTVYLLTSTVSGPVYGKLSDQYGRKPMLMIGIALFLFGSFLSGLSQTMTQLILFRGIQGLGAGAIFPVSLAVIGDLFTPAERGKYQGLFGAVFGIAALIGPALGGLLTDTLSWHWIFFVNLPIGLVALYIIGRVLPGGRPVTGEHHIDYLGVALFTAAVVPFLIGVTNKQTGEWADPAVGGLMVLGLALGIVFVFVESRAREPIVPLGLFRRSIYTTSVAASTLASFGFFAAVVFLPRFFQFVRGASATLSGYQVMALLIGVIASSIVSGQIVSRTGRYKWLMVGALGVAGVGLALFTQLHYDTPLPILWLWMFITGVGLGPTLAVFTIVVQNAVPFDQLGVATSNLTFFRQIGGTIGLAITGTIFGDTIRDAIPAQLVARGVPNSFVDHFAGHAQIASGALLGVGGDLGKTILALVPSQSAEFVRPLIPEIVTAIHEAFAISVANTFVVGATAMFGAMIVTLFLREIPLRATVEPRVRPAAPAPAGGVDRIDAAPAID